MLYTHTCNRKRSVAHCCMATATNCPDVETVTSNHSDHPQDEQDQAHNVVSPEQPPEPEGDVNWLHEQNKQGTSQLTNPVPNEAKSHNQDPWVNKEKTKKNHHRSN